jgi:hypothetical protein
VLAPERLVYNSFVKVVGLAAVAVLVVVVLSACGSSHRRYSVGEVEAVFASQGVHLHKGAKQVMPGFVVLRYGLRPHFIAVAVRAGKVPPGLQYYDAHSSDERLARHGNVIVIYDSGHSAAVKSALAELP